MKISLLSRLCSCCKFKLRRYYKGDSKHSKLGRAWELQRDGQFIFLIWEDDIVMDRI